MTWNEPKPTRRQNGLRAALAVALASAACTSGPSENAVGGVAGAQSLYEFAFIGCARDELGMPCEIDAFRFGPSDGSVVAYCDGFERNHDGARHVRWLSSHARGELVVANGLLRRVSLDAGKPKRVVFDRDLDPPRPHRDPRIDPDAADEPATRWTFQLGDAAPFVAAIDARVRASAHVRDSATKVELRPAAGLEVSGRVVDANGDALTNVRLVWWTSSGDYSNHVVTRDDGRFTVRTIESGTGWLWACVPGESARWPAVGQVVPANAEQVNLTLDVSKCRGSLRVTVPTLPGLGAAAVTTRLWQRASGLGMDLVRVRGNDTAAEFAATDLPVGHYALELCSPAFGVVSGGSFWCDGETEVELQRVSLPELCRITLERTRGTMEPFGFIFVRRGASFASCIARDRGFASTHLLGPGDYELWWQARGGDRARSLAFRIAPGQTELALAVPVDGVTASPRAWNELSR